MTTAALQPAMLAFTMALAVITGLVFGLVPALVVFRGNTWSLLKDDSTRGSAGRSTGLTRSVLVVAETAFALVLLVAAGLLLKSFLRLQNVDPGFATDHVLTAQISRPAARDPDAAARRAFWLRLLDVARALPGVTSAGLTTNVPFNGNVSSGSYSIVGYTPGPTESAPHGRQEVVGGDYFTAMRIPLIEGRFGFDLGAHHHRHAVSYGIVDRCLSDELHDHAAVHQRRDLLDQLAILVAAPPFSQRIDRGKAGDDHRLQLIGRRRGPKLDGQRACRERGGLPANLPLTELVIAAGADARA